MPVLVLVEHADGGADDVSRQAVTLARGYAEAAGVPLEAVLIGADAAARRRAGRARRRRRRTSPSTTASRRTRRRPGARTSPS